MHRPIILLVVAGLGLVLSTMLAGHDKTLFYLAGVLTTWFVIHTGVQAPQPKGPRCTQSSSQNPPPAHGSSKSTE